MAREGDIAVFLPPVSCWPLPAPLPPASMLRPLRSGTPMLRLLLRSREMDEERAPVAPEGSRRTGSPRGACNVIASGYGDEFNVMSDGA
jgi:hypothetical protein